ncbi:MAG TPA: glycosyl hydrolase family 18 protein [Actinomycetes bacterium]|nr:glycosyl hydrolase family 18 protein [Actinomycetes bacterium]
MNSIRHPALRLVLSLTVLVGLLTLGSASSASSADATAPFVVSPAQDAGITSSLVRFRWSDTSANQYQVALSASADFSQARSLLSSNQSVVTDVASQGDWFWKVRAVRPFIGPWSTTSSFTLDSSTILRPPANELQGPSNGADLHSADVTLRWAGHGEPVDLRLSRSASMSAPFERVVSSDNLTIRLDRGDWWWQVRTARNLEHDAGEWASARHITVSPTLDSRAPSRPGGVAIKDRTANGDAVVAWASSSDDQNGIKYWVRLDGRRVMSTAAHTGVRVHLPCGEASTITVVAVDRAGRASTPSPEANVGGPQCPDEKAPTTPQEVVSRNVAEETATVRWKRSTDNRQLSGYVLQRNGETVGGSTDTSYAMKHLRPSSPYTVDVYSRDNTGNVSLAAGSVDFTTATPIQADGDVRAFVLGSDGQSIADAQANYLSLDWIYPTYFTLSAGTLTGDDQPYVNDWFQVRGVKVLPRIVSADLAEMESTFATPESREAFAELVGTRAENGGWDGVQLDFEPSVPKVGVDGLTVDQRIDRFRGFLADVTARVAAHLHADGKLLSVAVPANWCQLSTRDPNSLQPVYCSDPNHTSATTRLRPRLYDYPAILDAADETWMMAWGLHWSTSEPGASADTRWATAVANWLATVVDDNPEWASKVTFGRSLYSQDWEYKVARTDVLALPATFPSGAAVPTCTDTNAKARPRPLPVKPGDVTVTLEWICPYGAAALREYQPVMKLLKQQGVEPTFDEDSGESFAKLPPVNAGFDRELWFSDERSVADLMTIAEAHGWRVGLWRLGLEDQRIWPLLDGSGA